MQSELPALLELKKATPPNPKLNPSTNPSIFIQTKHWMGNRVLVDHVDRIMATFTGYSFAAFVFFFY